MDDYPSLVSPSNDDDTDLMLMVYLYKMREPGGMLKNAQKATRELPRASCACHTCAVCKRSINIVESDFSHARMMSYARALCETTLTKLFIQFVSLSMVHA